jgi:hypothetical protein
MKRFNLPLIAAALLIILAGVAFFVAIQKVQNQEAVVVAKGTIPAYTVITANDVIFQKVPVASVEPQDITQAEWNKMKADFQPTTTTKQFGLVATAAALQGDRIDKREVADTNNDSFSIVSPDERVVAVTATLPGVAIGTIHAGDVVDASLNSGGGSGGDVTAQYAKVICVSASAAGCESVLPAGTALSVTGGNSTQTANSSSQVYVLLSVDEADAPTIAGQQVNLVLNPFCGVNQNGYFISTRTNIPCQVPGDRDASNSSQAANTNGAG